MNSNNSRSKSPVAVVIGAVATVIVVLAGGSSAHAVATLSIGLTAPIQNGEDIANLAAGTGSAKLWTDTRAIGQTFTTGSNALGYTLSAITLQSAAGSEPTKTYTLTIGTASGTSYNAFVTESGIVQSVSSVDDDYWTFTLDTPVTLLSNTLYGFDVAMTSSTSPWQSGIPYRASTSDMYAGGQQFQSLTNGQSTSTIQLQSGDKVFHLDMAAIEETAVPEPATVTLGTLAFGGMLMRRRRKA